LSGSEKRNQIEDAHPFWTLGLALVLVALVMFTVGFAARKYRSFHYFPIPQDWRLIKRLAPRHNHATFDRDLWEESEVAYVSRSGA
jgi:hypothetical protein